MSATAPWLRVVAIAIAIAGVIDPAIMRSSQLKPDVSLVVAGALPDPSLADRVARALEPIATVVRGPSIGAAGVVSVGYQLPDSSVRNTPAAFAIVPVARTPWVTIEAVRAPEHANLQARVPVAITVRVRSARTRSLAVQLEVGGVAIDRSTKTIASDDERVTVELGLVASAAGRMAPTITARIEGDAAEARAEQLVRVGSDRHAVLLFDRRPSWMSTFVRRALESDARFVVSSRVSTSRNAATVAGQPPTALADLDAFALVIVGAPDLMTPADADGLERFMHDRGGVVLLLMDAETENVAVDRLTGVTRWTRANRPEPSGVPLASEFQVPAELPRWADPIAFARAVSPTSVAPIWQTPIGRGRLIVSGALDSWRYRDVAFDQFWKALAADATTEATEEKPEVTERRTEVTELRAEGTEAKPEGRSGGTEDTEALLRAWTSSHHGSSLAESDLAALAPALSRTLAAPVESTPFHPMRSAWWIIPFAGLLGFEWWDRRKNGRR